MEIYERIFQLRKALKLSRNAFGQKLGVSGDVINNIESNRLARPDQKEPIYKLICKVFDVNEKWLVAGEGEMFFRTKESTVEEISKEYNLGFYSQKMIECFLNMSKQQQDVIENLLKTYAESCEKNSLDEIISLKLVGRNGEKTVTASKKEVLEALKKDSEMEDDIPDDFI